MNKEAVKILKSMEPCEDGYLFAKKCKDFRAVWETCKRSDWMVWLLGRLDFEDDRKLRLYACKCVRETPLADGRKVWDLLIDKRSRNAVEVAERFAVGLATKEELDYAAAAARDAAASASSAAYAAASTSAYAYAAAASTSAYAYAAAASAAAASWAASCAAVWDAALSAQSDMLRSFISWDEIEPFFNKYAEAMGGER